jgi:hypothetical protein
LIILDFNFTLNALATSAPVVQPSVPNLTIAHASFFITGTTMTIILDLAPLPPPEIGWLLFVLQAAGHYWPTLV